MDNWTVTLLNRRTITISYISKVGPNGNISNERIVINNIISTFRILEYNFFVRSIEKNTVEDSQNYIESLIRIQLLDQETSYKELNSKLPDKNDISNVFQPLFNCNLVISDDINKPGAHYFISESKGDGIKIYKSIW